jgi:hypothetical protein
MKKVLVSFSFVLLVAFAFALPTGDKFDDKPKKNKTEQSASQSGNEKTTEATTKTNEATNKSSDTKSCTQKSSCCKKN